MISALVVLVPVFCKNIAVPMLDTPGLGAQETLAKYDQIEQGGSLIVVTAQEAFSLQFVYTAKLRSACILPADALSLSLQQLYRHGRSFA